MIDISISVIRTDQNGRERKMTLTRPAWERIIENPNLVGGTWRLAPVVTTKREVVAAPEYTQKSYENDIRKGKAAMKKGNQALAVECFSRAVEFHPTPYYKGLITKLKK